MNNNSEWVIVFYLLPLIVLFLSYLAMKMFFWGYDKLVSLNFK